MRVIRLLLALGIALASANAQDPPAATQNRVKVAEGSHGEINSWVLWRSTDGYSAEIQILWKPPEFQEVRQAETLELSRSFLMRRVRYEVQKMPSLSDGALECVVVKQSLQCTSTFGQQEGRGIIPLAGSGAYATQFGAHIAFLDLPWFFTTLVANASPDASQSTQAWVVPIAFDGKTRDQLITSHNQAKASIAYLGREYLTVLGKRVLTYKYSIKALHYNSTVWTAKNGILLAVDWAGMRMELTRYKQYEEFVPELVGALEQVPPKKKPRYFSNID